MLIFGLTFSGASFLFFAFGAINPANNHNTQRAVLFYDLFRTKNKTPLTHTNTHPKMQNLDKKKFVTGHNLDDFRYYGQIIDVSRPFISNQVSYVKVTIKIQFNASIEDENLPRYPLHLNTMVVNTNFKGQIDDFICVQLLPKPYLNISELNAKGEYMLQAINFRIFSNDEILNKTNLKQLDLWDSIS